VFEDREEEYQVAKTIMETQTRIIQVPKVIYEERQSESSRARYTSLCVAVRHCVVRVAHSVPRYRLCPCVCVSVEVKVPKTVYETQKRIIKVPKTVIDIREEEYEVRPQRSSHQPSPPPVPLG
jgi:hypothetical protein